MCVRVCGISIFLFLHTSCELFYAERKERQVKTTSDLFSFSSSLVLSPFHSCCSAIPRRYLTSMLDGPATSTTYFIKNDKLQVADTCTCNPNNEELSISPAKSSSSSSSLSSLSSSLSSSSSSIPKTPFQNWKTPVKKKKFENLPTPHHHHPIINTIPISSSHLISSQVKKKSYIPRNLTQLQTSPSWPQHRRRRRYM